MGNGRRECRNGKSHAHSRRTAVCKAVLNTLFYQQYNALNERVHKRKHKEIMLSKRSEERRQSHKNKLLQRDFPLSRKYGLAEICVHHRKHGEHHIHSQEIHIGLPAQRKPPVNADNDTRQL